MIAIILGTRPEIIKMTPVLRACEKKNIDYQLIHTGQHYSYEMDKVFFQELELPDPDYNLNVGSGTHGEQTAKILTGIEKILMDEKYCRNDVVLVEGDTNSVLAAALAAAKLHIKIGHVEAGLRSYYKEMPEEINRILTDHISDYLFAPTENAKNILLKEGIEKEKIFVTGNTIVDAVYQNILIANKKKPNIFKELGIENGNYFLVTLHRTENVDNFERLKSIIGGLNLICKKYQLLIIFPIHPRTKKMIEKFKIKLNENIKLIDPMSYLEFLQLETNAKLVLTDSGGVQEETCILNVPCVTLRDNTERPETIEVGSNILAECNQDIIINKTELMLNKDKKWKNPFGDGNAAKKIINILQ
ncbi:MAG: UDP-N-acetylglucosamine 2-epimerase (non-hydrolyzing) [Candidatus Altiarchaeum hamiconexum]|uniref:UDP-N-acetylglucosamine 2-epimerase (Non-hydrolyzing) n=1 Tax=Candidatus Altarchaeum hamiconexum TaxID=1803513 RepID=A0A8J7YTG7_9ARCH|nr:UDP-N-acetylglucosamine 2-epimerase (non-hydrolyzing) [Candidatus Altarchaeum hamiconexum]NCS90837.1 UDP-N-acetylglucosamine 2-epimerase (non-hydrolyzing) [Candidatus Altarchaeum hamiconexum]PIV28654.1 MAG: UDP-N-acetylglucosamine 2-epimerase (non-hydrolyzing) [Candidatus Altarchaeum sp. CG03_land_8_20_14_0_80_32_618]